MGSKSRSGVPGDPRSGPSPAPDRRAARGTRPCSKRRAPTGLDRARTRARTRARARTRTRTTTEWKRSGIRRAVQRRASRRRASEASFSDPLGRLRSRGMLPRIWCNFNFGCGSPREDVGGHALRPVLRPCSGATRGARPAAHHARARAGRMQESGPGHAGAAAPCRTCRVSARFGPARDELAAEEQREVAVTQRGEPGNETHGAAPSPCPLPRWGRGSSPQRRVSLAPRSGERVGERGRPITRPRPRVRSEVGASATP
jgi:hypothetical protein